jgi:hypothetical protein
LLVLIGATAYAQPGADPPPEGTPPPPEAPVATPLAPLAAPPLAVDPPELVAEYDRAFRLLLSEQWDAAARAFSEIASRSVDLQRRAAAIELARYGREMDERADEGPKRNSGRASFVATTTLASFYAGFVIDDFLAVEDIKAQTLLVTGVTLGGFTASLFATKDRRITESMASAYGSGLLVGAGNGLLLAPRLGIEPDASSSADGDVNQNYLVFGLLTMAGGGAAATYLADRFDPTPAQAQFAGLMGVNGLATVGLSLAMIQPDSMDYRNLLLLLALGLDGGVVGGVVLGRDLTWSKSRMTYVTLAEFLGGLTGVAAAVVTVDNADSDDGLRVGAGLVLGGVWGGFALATHLTSDMAPDPRFRVKGPTVSLVPMMGSQMRGLAVGGTF